MINSLERQVEALQSDLDFSKAREDELQKCCDHMVATQANSETVPIEIVEGTRARLSMAEEAREKTTVEKQELEATVHFSFFHKIIHFSFHFDN